MAFVRIIINLIHFALCFPNIYVIGCGWFLILDLLYDTKPINEIIAYIFLVLMLSTTLPCVLLSLPKSLYDLKESINNRKQIRTIFSLINIFLSGCGILALRNDPWTSQMPLWGFLLLSFVSLICSVFILPEEYISKFFKKRAWTNDHFKSKSKTYLSVLVWAF